MYIRQIAQPSLHSSPEGNGISQAARDGCPIPGAIRGLIDAIGSEIEVIPINMQFYRVAYMWMMFNRLWTNSQYHRRNKWK